MEKLNCKLLVIGGGPGGYVTAIRAGQLGIDTIVVEERALGGTCLNIGCIPSKAIIHAADEFYRLSHYDGSSPLGIAATKPTIDYAATVTWKDSVVKRLTGGVEGLIRKAGTKYINGTAELIDGKSAKVAGPDGAFEISAENIVIATGSDPVELPFLPYGDDMVINSTGALALESVPKTLAVVGGGYIGLEIGTAFAKLGSKVTVVEAEKHILPQYDTALTRPVVKSLEKLGVTVFTGAKATGKTAKGLEIETADGTAKTIPAEKILVTVGRRPRSRGAGIPSLSLTMDGSFIRIDGQCRTSMRGVFAIGDVTGEPMLAHRAMAQGEMVAEIIAGEKREWDKVAIPAVCFTDPEVVTCGLSPDEAKARGIDIVTGQFPFTANARAMTMESDGGFVRAVARKDNHVLVGLQAVGTHVSELSAAFAILLEMGARLEDVAGTIHAHPTQSEGLLEASLSALGHALHI